uniref:Uncharacterized protein MANES_11G008600 n=1 Tax=Rhizophora mucronata TaxID=61149 RepID=A0A2P2KQM9_RHIMU
MSSTTKTVSSPSSCKAPVNMVAFLLNRSWRTCDAQETSLLLRDCAEREINALLWVFLITITAFCVEKLIRLLRPWVKASGIPGPPSHSFFGHFSCFGSSRHYFIDFLSESHSKYGTVLKLWLGPTQLLVSIKDPALIKEILLKAKDRLPFSGKAFRLAFGQSSLFYCPYEQAQKRRESLAFELNEKLLERPDVIPKIVFGCIRERIDELMHEGGIDITLVSQHMAFTILGTTLFGEAFLAWSKASFYEELLMMIAKDASFWASYRLTPFWKRGFWKYQSLCMKLKFLTQDIIQQCRRNYNLLRHKDDFSHNDIVKIGMKTSSLQAFSGAMTQDKLCSKELNGNLKFGEEPCGNFMGVMCHGCVATKNLIYNLLEWLAKDPEMQAKIYAEILMVRQGLAKEEQDINKMVLLLATVYESVRLLSAAPLLQRCSLKEDLQLKNGVIIPAGAIVVVPVELMQTDDSSWGSDATKFNPYRFLSKVLKDPSNNATFLPFGFGARACVGQKFIIQGVASLFAALLEHYEVRVKPESGDSSNSTTPEIVLARRNA